MGATIPAYNSQGKGAPVVLLHASFSSKGQWKALSALLANSYRVIAVDLYGYGETPMPADRERFTLLDEVDLVRSLLDRILPPGEPCHLVGHSYGGAVALRFGHHAPERVRTVTVFEPVAFHLLAREDPALQPVHDLMAELGRLLAADRRTEAAALFLDYWSGPGSFAKFPARVQKDFAQRTEKLALDFQALTRARLTMEDYRQIRLPVAVIAGRSSRLPAMTVARKLARVLPDGTLTWVDTGHMGPVTHPQLVNPVIAASLAP